MALQSKDIHITSPCVAELVTTELPPLGANEVRVKLAFSTVSSGTERANITGDPFVSVFATEPNIPWGDLQEERFLMKSGW